MPILSILVSNYKLIVLLGASLGLFYAGWHSHSWYDAYTAQKAEIKAIDSLGKGETKIIKFNSAFDKEKASAKDNCIDKPIPPNIAGLLK